MSASSTPTRGFRLFWAGTTLLAWAAFAALALHRSDPPDLLGRYSPAYARLLAGALAACAGLTAANTRGCLAWIEARRRELLLLPVSALVALLAAELFLRVFDPIGISFYTENARYAHDRVPDPLLLYRQPRSTTRWYQGVEVRYNEAGLRDDPIGPKAAGEWRVLVLGDSVVFGWGVEQEKTLSADLQRLLAQELHRPVRVINTGVCSYNTVMELAWLREHGFPLQPDLVLLVYHTNDVLPSNLAWNPEAGVPQQDSPFTYVADSLLRRTWLYQLLVHVRRKQPLRSVPARPDDPSWQASMQALRALVEETQARHLGVAAYLFSWQLDADLAELLAAMRSAMAPAAVEETASWFAGGRVGRHYVSAVDHHPNAEAHAVIAQRILESLRAQHLLPNATPTQLSGR